MIHRVNLKGRNRNKTPPPVSASAWTRILGRWPPVANRIKNTCLRVNAKAKVCIRLRDLALLRDKMVAGRNFT